MTYEKWLEEMNKGRRTQLQEQKKLIMDAAAKCSKETRRDLAPFLKDLDALFAGPAGEPDLSGMNLLLEDEEEDRKPVTREEFGRITQNLGAQLSEMILRYAPPVDLLSQQGAAGALINILETIDGHEKKYQMPDFTSSNLTDSATLHNYENYAAQIIAMNDLGAEATPREFIGALASIPRIQKSSVFKSAIQDPQVRIHIMTDRDQSYFKDLYRKKLDEYEAEHAKSFKQLSEDIAKQYRKDQKYAELELRMNALRAIAGAKEKDRSKWDDIPITVTEFTNKVKELQQAAAGPSKNEKTPEAYQAELAMSVTGDYDIKTKCIHEVYNASPVFREEFDLTDKKYTYETYRRKDFEENIKNIDISGYSFGGKPLSNDEFGSLSYLSVIDPKLAGGFLATNGRTTEIGESTIATAVSELMMCTTVLGDETVVKDGKTLHGPDGRIGGTLRIAIGPARRKAETMLKAWNEGDKTQLARLIAEGLDHVLNDLRHTDYEGMKLNADQFTHSNMIKGALDLLKRDDELMALAKKAGLKDATITELEGIRMCNDIEKAGIAARERLVESAKGLRTLSPFEKGQCALAVQRYDTLLKDLVKSQREWRESAEYKKAEKEYDDADPGEISVRGNWELSKNDLFALHKCVLKQTRCMKRPAVFMDLGKEGIAGLDKMLPQDSLDPKDAAAMTSREIAQKLGLVETRQIDTTAKEVYDQLTKAYKAHEIDYTLYEARLRIMRDLTGGDKNAKIDVKTLDDAIEEKLKRSLGPVENQIDDMLKMRFAGRMGKRLSNIYKAYGLKPMADETSVKSGMYTKEEFSVLKTLKKDHMVIGKHELDQIEFGALAVAATQAFPEIGAVYLVPKKDGPGYENLIKEPTVQEAAALRSFYVSDVDQGGKDAARKGIGSYFGAVTQPAREKVDAIFKAYQKGQGKPDELGKLIGLGIKNYLNSIVTVDNGGHEMKETSAIEGHILGQLAGLAELDPKVRKEVTKYASPKELDMAKGMGVVYDIVHGAKTAREKLTASAQGKEPLTGDERRACVELLLREKILMDIGNKHAKLKMPDELETKILMEEEANSKHQNSSLSSMEAISKVESIIGLPDYVAMLGKKGPLYARELLDKNMPDRASFADLEDSKILEALTKKPGEKGNPFEMEEYKKPVYKEDHQLDNSLREFKTREKAKQQKTL